DRSDRPAHRRAAGHGDHWQVGCENGAAVDRGRGVRAVRDRSRNRGAGRRPALRRPGRADPPVERAAHADAVQPSARSRRRAGREGGGAGDPRVVGGVTAVPIPITVPRLGWNMEHGTFVEWLKADGDAVRKGDIVFRLEGEKAVEEIESFDAGTLSIP